MAVSSRERVSSLFGVVQETHRGLIVLTAIGATVAAMVAAAWVRIPIPGSPVPITLQTMIVLLAGAMLGRTKGALALAIYALLGEAGLPVFTGGKAGFALFLSTGGYLLGFIFAAWLIGHVLASMERPHVLDVVLAMLAGTLIIYILGALQLAQVWRLDAITAIQWGVLPFIVGDLLKLAAAVAIWRATRDWSRKYLA